MERERVRGKLGAWALSFESYTANDSPASLADYTLNESGGFTLDNVENWQYNASDASLGYYEQSYAYDGGNYPVSSYQEDYNPAAEEVGGVDSYYNTLGYVTEQENQPVRVARRLRRLCRNRLAVQREQFRRLQ